MVPARCRAGHSCGIADHRKAGRRIAPLTCVGGGRSSLIVVALRNSSATAKSLISAAISEMPHEVKQAKGVSWIAGQHIQPDRRQKQPQKQRDQSLQRAGGATAVAADSPIIASQKIFVGRSSSATVASCGARKISTTVPPPMDEASGFHAEHQRQLAALAQQIGLVDAGGRGGRAGDAQHGARNVAGKDRHGRAGHDAETGWRAPGPCRRSSAPAPAIVAMEPRHGADEQRKCLEATMTRQREGLHHQQDRISSSWQHPLDQAGGQRHMQQSDKDQIQDQRQAGGDDKVGRRADAECQQQPRRHQHRR